MSKGMEFIRSRNDCDRGKKQTNDELPARSRNMHKKLVGIHFYVLSTFFKFSREYSVDLGKYICLLFFYYK